VSGIAAIVADNLDIWTSAIERKGSAGRGSSRKTNLYGIERLRSLILDLAVCGKLEPQNPREGSTGDLLELIRSEKPGYLKEHFLPNRTKATEPILEELFELPENWEWVRLGEIAAYIQRGKSPKYEKGSALHVVSQRCVQWTGLDLSVAKEISDKSLESYEDYRFLRSGDLLWNSTGTGTIGRVIALSDVPEMLVCDSHVTLVRCPWVDSSYLQSWLASNAVYGQIEHAASGSTNQIEWTAKLAMAQPVPLPPFAEQKRIMAKVDELMALCVALERESEDALAAHQTLVETLLATLVNSTDAPDLAKSWARLEKHFDTLFTTRPSIDAFKQTILDLAVRGLLLPQNDDGEGAAALITRARKVQAQAIAKKRMRRPKSLNEPIQPPKGVELPNGWEWTRLIDIAEINPKNEVDDDAEVSFVPMPLVSDRTDGAHDFEPRKWGEIKKGYTHFADGDIALAKITPCFENGKAAIFWGLVNGVGAGTTELHVARPLIDEIERRYLLLNMKTSRFLAEGEANMTGTAGQKRVPRSYFELTPLPLPPVVEQKRIVAKVDELMTLCENLKTSLADAAETQRHLADAIVERAAA
jgi:type I restriction enzyme S subunit